MRAVSPFSYISRKFTPPFAQFPQRVRISTLGGKSQERVAIIVFRMHVRVIEQDAQSFILAEP